MTVDRRSRYWALPSFQYAGRLATGLRPIPNLEASERFILHTLSASETLDQLALRYYGRDDLWWRIADANPGRFPLDWKPGDVLRIPASQRVTRLP